MIPAVKLSTLLAVYEPAVALKLRFTTVPTAMLEEAVMLKLKFRLPPAMTAEKLKVPVFTVIPDVLQVRVADPVEL